MPVLLGGHHLRAVTAAKGQTQTAPLNLTVVSSRGLKLPNTPLFTEAKHSSSHFVDTEENPAEGPGSAPHLLREVPKQRSHLERSQYFSSSKPGCIFSWLLFHTELDCAQLRDPLQHKSIIKGLTDSKAGSHHTCVG